MCGDKKCFESGCIAFRLLLLDALYVFSGCGIHSHHIPGVDKERCGYFCASFESDHFRPALRRVALDRRRRLRHLKIHLDRQGNFDDLSVKEERRYFRIRLQKLRLLARAFRGQRKTVLRIPFFVKPIFLASDLSAEGLPEVEALAEDGSRT